MTISLMKITENLKRDKKQENTVLKYISQNQSVC